MFDASVHDPPALDAGTAAEADITMSQPADVPNNPAPLTQEDRTAIVEEFKEHYTSWLVETQTSHGAVEAKLRRERRMGALLLDLKEAGLLDKGGRPSKSKTHNGPLSVSLEDL